MTPMGRGAAMRSTKSNSPASGEAATSSRTSTAMRSISSWRERMARGVNRGMAVRRSGPWRGGSRVTTISMGWLGAPSLPRMRPCWLENRSGWEDTSTMSACRVTAQNDW